MRKQKTKVAYFDSDENAAFIVGYTSGGAAYGLTHAEMEAIIHQELLEKLIQLNSELQEDAFRQPDECG